MVSEERHEVYRMLRLKVLAPPDGSPDVRGSFGDGWDVCKN